MALPTKYEIYKELKEWLDASDFANVCDKLFEVKIGTLAERTQRALGWMTRARSAISLPERFILFFTALEGLLTHDDKNAPVTETIARNVATILAIPENRFFIYKRMKDLYGIRSTLVHSGKREVSQTDCNQRKRGLKTA